MKKYVLLSVVLLSAFRLFSQSLLFGVTSQGGANNAGSLFSIEAGTTALTTLYSFSSKSCSPEGDLIEVNGKFYGVTASGGDHNFGVIFEYDPATSLTDKFSFSGDNGSQPIGSLLSASNGKLYGMTVQGGSNSLGVLFEYDVLTNTLMKKIDFNGAGNGVNPIGSLMEAANGKIYGMTTLGGVNGYGVLFEYDITSNTLTKKVDFAGTSNGTYPYGKLLQASNGKLYGLTSGGGTYGEGTLFEYDIALGSLANKFNFASISGIEPYGSLIELSNGKLYGLTTAGGTYGAGVIFEYDPLAGTMVKKIEMGGGIQGEAPYGSLLSASDGKLYGMTSRGGENQGGMLFEYDPVGNVLQKRIDFAQESGIAPRGSFIQASDGQLYGMTSKGGPNNVGTIFRFDVVSKSSSPVQAFVGAPEGKQPMSSLVNATNGKLYGLTFTGGKYNEGTVFEYDRLAGTFTKKIDLSATTTGKNPESGFIQASNGKLYGLTLDGGTYSSGTLIEYDIENNVLIKRVDFSGTANGKLPVGRLLEVNGKLYGMTTIGGTADDGVVFEYDLTSHVLTPKFEFPGTSQGLTPQGSLVKVSSGKVYGMTTNGGSHDGGTLFEYDVASGILTNKADFEAASTGAYPNGNLVEGLDGKLYGTTSSGGVGNQGVIFVYDPVAGTLVKKFELSFSAASDGLTAHTSLTRGANGKLYGATYYGGSNNKGVIFEYDPPTSKYTKMADFGMPNGEFIGADLIEVCLGSAMPGAITGAASVCPVGTTPYTFSISQVASATSYTWNLPQGATLVSGAGTTSVVIDFRDLQPGAYSISVSAVSACGPQSSPEKGITVQASPAAPMVTVTQPTCNVATGSIVIEDVDGESYTFNGTSFGPGNVQSSLSAGTYHVGIKNSQGCVALADVALVAMQKPEKPTITINNSHPAEPVLTASGSGTFQWYRNGEAIDGATNKTYIVQTGGDYTVTVANDQCVSDASDKASMTITGINEQPSLANNLVYPNPAQHAMKISLARFAVGEPVSVSTCNAMGQRLDTREAHGGEELTLDVSSYVDGYYVLQLQQGSSFVRTRFIKASR